MACAAKSAVNFALMATTGCPTSAPALFVSLKKQTHVSIPSKSVKFHLACSHSSIFLKKEESILRFAAIAAQQGESNPVLLEDEEYEGGFNWGKMENGAEGQESDGLEEGESYQYVEPPEEAKLYVGNLPFDIDSEKFAKLFEGAGVVEIAEVIYNRDTDQSRGFGFVTMSTVDEAEKAVEMFNRYDLSGRFLTVSKASPKGSRPERPPRVSSGSNRIYAGNLPWSVDSDRLEQVFSEHGKVVSAQVLVDRESGRSRGFGFVVMSSESEMNEAIANLDGQNLDGRAIRVNVAEDRPRRGGF